ncbi:MAG: hypothetical protein HUJ73_01690 [Eubacterium sp.]|nr:hypothetical protein [Eubacterium sp.]
MKENEKGRPGYIRSQKKIRGIRTLILFIIVFAIFVIGLILNGGDRSNLFSIIAAIALIPAALSATQWIVALTLKETPEELVKRIASASQGHKVLYELYVTTRENSILLNAVVISGSYVLALTSDPKHELRIPPVRKHLRTALQNADPEAEVEILHDQEQFLKKMQELPIPETEEDENPEKEFQSILFALSM